MDRRVNILTNFMLLIRRRVDQLLRPLELRAIFPPRFPESVPYFAAPEGFSPYRLDPPLLVLGFCFTATSVAMQQVQHLNKLPMSFHLVCLTMILSFAALCLSIYISRNSEAQRQVLQHVGVFFGATSFFFAITISFPLCLKLIAWSIYALSLLWIFLSYHV